MLPIHYFCRKDAKGAITDAPFIEYLNDKYLTRTGGPKSLAAAKQFHTVMAVVQHIAGSFRGGYTLPPYSEHYRDHRIGVMKLHEGKRLVRIAYYAEVKGKLVILTAYDKPALYEKGTKKKVDKDIEKHLAIAEQCLDDLLAHPTHSNPLSHD